ncbi:MAG: hypothetical protein IJW82_06815 [Clostridia bacterium]|nr:hypothetical protein [Clostridia bacterium]
MRKKILYLGFIMFLIIPFVPAINNTKVYAEQTQETQEIQIEQEDLSKWFNDEVIPALISLGVSILAIITAFQPVLKTISSGVMIFKSSKNEYDKTTEKVLATQKEITEFKTQAIDSLTHLKNELILTNNDNKNQIKEIQEDMIKKLNSMQEELNYSKKEIDTLLEIIKIGFCNNSELVKNGYAREIIKVVNNNGSKENKKENTIVSNT